MNPDDMLAKFARKHARDAESYYRKRRLSQIRSDAEWRRSINGDSDDCYDDNLYYEDEIDKLECEHQREIDELYYGLESEFEDQVEAFKEEIKELKAKLAKTDKMEALLGQYELYSEIKYDRDTFELEV